MANPGYVNIGTVNPGSTQNLAAEYFRAATNIEATIIPYKTSPDILAAMIRGELDMAIESPTAFAAALESEQVRALAITGAKRNPSLPEVPTVMEAGIERYEVSGWNALWTLDGVPDDVITALHAAMAEIAVMPDIQARFAELNTRAESLTPEEMAARFESDRLIWAQVIEDSGIEKR
ncbi:MAG: hypothetical protein COB08_009010 [Rhodobacteraceae bacterium]|nr:hypothetical protein [Paracoccaceae bacterium]